MMCKDHNVIEWYDSQDDEAARRRCCPRLTALQLKVLWQLRMTVWDGYVASKLTRDSLVAMGLAARLNGWNFITRPGMAVLDTYGLLRDERYGTRGDAGDGLWTLKPEQYARLKAEGLLLGS